MKHTNPKPCQQCGSRHEWFNITIENRTLRRIADSNRGQMLTRVSGGAWAFAARLLNAHAAEIDRIEIYDRATGITYYSTLQDWFDVGFLRDLGAGLQRILPIADMQKSTANEPTPTPATAQAQELAPVSDGVQPILISSTEIQGAIYTPAKSKRPRTFKQRSFFNRLDTPRG